MSKFEEAAAKVLAERQEQQARTRTYNDALRLKEKERDEFLVEFLDLMQSRGVPPEITYRQDHKFDHYWPRPAPSYDRTAVTGWVASSTPELDGGALARGILVTADGTWWNYEALTIPYDRILARSPYISGPIIPGRTSSFCSATTAPIVISSRPNLWLSLPPPTSR